jgi:hypothetical protein
MTDRSRFERYVMSWQLIRKLFDKGSPAGQRKKSPAGNHNYSAPVVACQAYSGPDQLEQDDARRFIHDANGSRSVGRS